MAGDPYPKPAPRVKASPRGLRSKSPGRSVEDREWQAYSARIRKARPWCELGPDGPFGAQCRQRSTDVHHRWPTGSGGPRVPSAGLTDDGVLALCNPCHIVGVHGNIKLSRSLGLLKGKL